MVQVGQWLVRLCVVTAFVMAGQAQAQDNAARGKTAFILAASWQPAFCQENQRKRECATQGIDRFDATNFSLHGLWPLRQDYCGVSGDQRDADKSGRWSDLPAVRLSADVRSDLDRAMPGTQSGLERHEWIKHGTCTGMSADAYFTTAVHLIDQLNASPVRDLFARHIGKTLGQAEIASAFDESFGEGASSRVKMSCRRVGNQRVITEITIGLSRDVKTAGADAMLGDLIQAAGGTSFGCNSGVVDAAGF